MEVEVRGGTVNEKDLETPLEKKRTSRIAKDPNLVWRSSCHTERWLVVPETDKMLGDLGWS